MLPLFAFQRVNTVQLLQDSDQSEKQKKKKAKRKNLKDKTTKHATKAELKAEQEIKTFMVSSSYFF